ncbi:hypothetical protein OAL04_09615 [Nitrospinae bacterium]|nr:hypothetical protein [Nitrospinota bacterium]
MGKTINIDLNLWTKPRIGVLLYLSLLNAYLLPTDQPLSIVKLTYQDLATL